uniref:HDC03634 n=1 Tax=Drosophila melanogaster TaxID=7227 RepID=Q6IH19_DROME|nr:TPA_inf: HDC03634 [Drosophila melanogaster]
MQLGAGSSSPDPFLARTIRLDNDQLFAARPEYPGTFWNCKEAKLRQAWAKFLRSETFIRTWPDRPGYRS